MKKIYNFFLRIETLNRAAFVMMLSVFFVGQVWGEVVTFSGSNLNAVSGSKTVGCITLSSSGMTYSDGLSAGGGGKTFTLTATDATISQVVITTDKNDSRYSAGKITNCTSCTLSDKVYTCVISPAVNIVSCTNHSGGVKITQIEVTYTPTSDPAISTKTVCLNPDVSNWKLGNERYAVYCFGDGEEWYDMTLVSDGCGGKTYYKADVDPKYTTYIFCRMNGGTTENNWDNKWNQTNDLAKADGTYCTITSAGGGTTKAGCNWNHTPFEICISGPEYAFADDPLVLKATCPGATYFQWYKGGTAESNKIEGATSATYRKGNCVFEDAGTYYCKAGGNESSASTSSGKDVKMFRMYFNVGRGGTDYGHVDLHNTDPDNHKAEGMIFLGEDWDYAFSITDGFGHWYGNNNTNTTAMWSGNCTNWSMPLGAPQCWLRSDNGATYTFTLDYSNLSDLRISAAYPPGNQGAGLMIYFDNSVVNWTNLHYRVGKLNQTTKAELSKVPGTANLYQYETQEYPDLNAWHIADNCGWSGDGDDRSIYRTKTDDSYAITNSVNFEGGATTHDITITPRNEHSTGSDSYNNNCEFYPYSMSPGMKKQNVEIAECTGGTVTVSYTDVDDTPQSFTTGNRYLAHTCKLTITAVPDCGQKIVSLQVNGVDFTSGDTYILSADAVIEAVFADDPTATYDITYHLDDGTINSGNVTSYTYLTGATLPTDVTKSGNWDFDGWYDNSSLSGDPVTEITPSDCGDKKFWAKWKNHVATFQYILGSCYVKDGMWTAGKEGSVDAWRYIPGADVASGTLKATDDISISTTGTAGLYFNTKDLSKLDVESYWGTSSSDNKTIKAIKVESNKTVTFDLGSRKAKKITYYVFPGSGNSYTVDLTVNGSTSTKSFSSEQNKWHKYQYIGNFTGKFSIKSNDKESRVVVVVELPAVTITFDKNSTGATGTMESVVIPNGTEHTLPSNTFEWTGHEFQCWTEGSTTGPEIANRAKYTANTDVTLYAKWVEHIETIVTLSAPDADNDDFTKSVTAVYTKDLPTIPELPTREWFTFDGYFENPDGSGKQYYSSTGESVNVWDKTTPTATIYAKWTEIKHTTITLVATGAYNHYTSSVVAALNQPMPAIPNLPLSTSKVFAGYFKNPDGTGKQYYTASGTSANEWDQDVANSTLYAKWMDQCDIAPTLTSAAPIITIWNGQKADVTLATLSCALDTTTLKYSYVSASENIAGCEYKYFDSRLHLIGTPTGYLTETTKTITFTFQNNCDPARSYNVEQTIRIYPTGKKARLAFIITGEEGAAFNKYTADDSTSCAELIAYLNKKYDVTCVNGYATKNTSNLATYYAQYDLLIVTDFLDTGKGYTNAIGTLIDKKPILSFEAYVANQSNWHIGSNPKDPKPKVQDMKVLCAGHAIFADAKYDEDDPDPVDVINDTDTTVHVLDALSTEKDAKGLQGFTINEAPDFIFIATVKDADNKRDLIVCCERQVVFSARLMLYGINFYEMSNLSKAGRIIIRQMVDYLLMTDETRIADCSLVFDNGYDPDLHTIVPGGGDHLWNNPKNWSPGRNIVPTPVHPTRIIAECHVDYDKAHAGSVKVNTGRDEHGNLMDGKLIIEPNGGLTIAGMVATVHDTRYASPVTIAAENLLIKANDGNNGAFVYGNKESDVRATVQYYSRGSNAQTPKPVWQYMGIPFQSEKTAIQMYHYAWMCRWANGSTDGLGGLWQWVQNDDVLLPFEGYCITQEAAKTYEFAGKLNAPVTTTLQLDNRDTEGFAFAANSWTAPIKISQMQDDDFTNAEKSIYIYHTGTYADWNTHKDEVINTKTSSTAVLSGQYAVIPIHASPYIGVDSVIPAMQGFFVKTDPSKEASLKLVYNRVVYDSKYFKTSTQPMRAPSRTMELSDAPEVMVLTVVGDSLGADRVHILSRGDFSQSYEDGWDGRKVEGDAIAPKLSVVKDCGEMAVAAIETPEGQYLSFRAGEDSIYTFTFDYEGETIYLYDRLADEAAEIRTGNTYTFRATNKTAAERFLITATPPRTPTQIETIGAEPRSEKAEKIIHDNKLMILYHGAVYDAQGARVTIGKEGAR